MYTVAYKFKGGAWRLNTRPLETLALGRAALRDFKQEWSTSNTLEKALLVKCEKVEE